MKDMTTKEKILFAALDLISEKGYDGVGVDLIAENAGLKGPSLYRHYKGKEDIFISLIDMVESYYTKGFGLKNTEERLWESMNDLVKNTMERIQFTMYDDMIRKIRRVLAMEQFRSKRMAELTTRYYLENLQEMYKNIFTSMMKKGILKQDDPEYLALEFVSPITIFIHIYDRQPEREAEVLERINKHLEHFVKTYGEEETVC